MPIGSAVVILGLLLVCLVSLVASIWLLFQLNRAHAFRGPLWFILGPFAALFPSSVTLEAQGKRIKLLVSDVVLVVSALALLEIYPFPQSVKPDPSSQGGRAGSTSSRVAYSVGPVSEHYPSILTNCSTPRASRAGHPRLCLGCRLA
jgi:hypothetical protein